MITGVSRQSNVGTLLIKVPATILLSGGASISLASNYLNVYPLKGVGIQTTPSLYISSVVEFDNLNLTIDYTTFGSITSYYPQSTPQYINFSGIMGGNYFIPEQAVVGVETQTTTIYVDSSNQVTTLPSNRELLFGVITSDKSVYLEVINKRLDSIVLTSHIVPPEFGCVIEGIPVGYIIPPESSAFIKVTAKVLLGDSEVSAMCPIYFDKVTIWVYVVISRQPIVVYSLHPDKSSYKESYTFKTNVFESTTGRERRTPLIKTSKTKVDYDLTTTSIRDSAFILNNLYAGTGSVMYQPLWAFVTRLTEPAISTVFLSCDTYWDVFEVGGYCGVYIDEYSVILARIVAINTNTLEVSKPVTTAPGSFIVPLIIGTPDKSQGRKYSNSNDNTINVSLVEL